MTRQAIEELTHMRLERSWIMGISARSEIRKLTALYSTSQETRGEVEILDKGRIFHVGLLRLPAEEQFGGLDLIYSRTLGGRTLMTARGYAFDGEVLAYSQRAREIERKLTTEEERAALELSRIDLYHVGKIVEGDLIKEKLEGALRYHRRRIRGMKLQRLTMEEELGFLERARDNLPRS